MLDNGILSQLLALGMPQHDSVAERRNWPLLRSMMSYSDIYQSSYGDIVNSVPTKSLYNTLVELWAGHKANLQCYRIWTCSVYVLNKDQKVKN